MGLAKLAKLPPAKLPLAKLPLAKLPLAQTTLTCLPRKAAAKPRWMQRPRMVDGGGHLPPARPTMHATSTGHALAWVYGLRLHSRGRAMLSLRMRPLRMLRAALLVEEERPCASPLVHVWGLNLPHRAMPRDTLRDHEMGL